MRMNIHNMLTVFYILVLIVKFWFGATFFMIKKDHFKCKMLLWSQVPFKYFAIFTSKHLCWRLFLIKRDSNTGISCEYCEIFKNIYFEEHLRTAASNPCNSSTHADVEINLDLHKRIRHINMLLNHFIYLFIYLFYLASKKQ